MHVQLVLNSPFVRTGKSSTPTLVATTRSEDIPYISIIAPLLYFYYIYPSYIWICSIMDKLNAVSHARLVPDVLCSFGCELFV